MLCGLADKLLLLKCYDNKMVKSPGGFYIGFPSTNNKDFAKYKESKQGVTILLYISIMQT